MNMEFYKCDTCGQMIAIVTKTDAPIVCCGKYMNKIIARNEESMFDEKHSPVFRIKKNKVIVYVGVVPHPSNSEHYIEWIAIKTNKGNQRKTLKPGDEPKATFCIDDDEVIEEIYAYCNIHSLWKMKELDKDQRESNKCHECEIKGNRK